MRFFPGVRRRRATAPLQLCRLRLLQPGRARFPELQQRPLACPQISLEEHLRAAPLTEQEAAAPGLSHNRRAGPDRPAIGPGVSRLPPRRAVLEQWMPV